MDIVVRTVVLGVVGSVICLVVGKGSPELSLMLATAVALLAVTLALEVMGTVMEFIEVIRDAAELSPAVLTPVLRTVGIAILTRLAADICRDAGQSAVASAVELAGTFAAVYIALPLLQTVFEMIGGLL